ncbi:hypothetical protein [Wolbachia endosymbiont of Armadillidium vulgare]|nr:hypothetical protein [Wolbachia endosymbiont of Armadillidium vulgare]
MTLFVLSAVVIAFSYKIICQNKKLDVKGIELNRLAREYNKKFEN